MRGLRCDRLRGRRGSGEIRLPGADVRIAELSQLFWGSGCPDSADARASRILAAGEAHSLGCDRVRAPKWSRRARSDRCTFGSSAPKVSPSGQPLPTGLRLWLAVGDRRDDQSEISGPTASHRSGYRPGIAPHSRAAGPRGQDCDHFGRRVDRRRGFLPARPLGAGRGAVRLQDRPETERCRPPGATPRARDGDRFAGRRPITLVSGLVGRRQAIRRGPCPLLATHRRLWLVAGANARSGLGCTAILRQPSRS